MRRAVRIAVPLAAAAVSAVLLMNRTDEPSRAPSGIVVVPAADRTAWSSAAVEPAANDPGPAAGRQAVRTASPEDLRTLVRTESRDPAWAGETEIAVRSVLELRFGMGGDSPLDVSCASTVCEVTGVQSSVPASARDLGRVGEAAGAVLGPGLRVAASGPGADDGSFVFYVQRT